MVRSVILWLILATTVSSPSTTEAAIGDFMATKAWGTTNDRATKAPAKNNNRAPKASATDNNRPAIKELNKWAAGTIVFNPQPAMTLYEWHSFDVIISPVKYSKALLEKLVRSLRRPTFVQYTSVNHVTSKMKIQLSGGHPDDFDITPKEPVVLDIVQAAKQDFSVMPLKGGLLNLYLNVKPVIYDRVTGKETTINGLDELNRKIEVEVTTVGSIKRYSPYVKDYWTVIASISGVFAIGAGYAWRKRAEIFSFIKRFRS
ncbi:hypothetical protein KP001_14410 [Geomonas subterranea]|uniref:Uncharacterized protein n=1 Tax=Geomonas subterranea TaxID=2847989 RepID=A0ABX8LFH4_9BACT|nr:hypothetical protein [Geomonas subterranea]QXE89626.1 hypothetical protein KP001_14410 [Geomonas subterranea]QXM08258.1 hypothetical protein KP002_14870 [Geomonas subterranea]